VIIYTVLPLRLSALNIYEVANDHKLEINYFKLYKDYKPDSLNLGLLANRPFEGMKNTTIDAKANISQIISFQLCNNSEKQKSRYLYFTSIDFSSISIYTSEDDKMVKEIGKIGCDHPHSSRNFINSRPIFELTVGSNSCQTIYLKIDQKYLSVNTRIYLYTAAQLTEKIEDMSFDGGVDIGISMTYFVATFILILFSRSRQNTCYFIYLSGNVLYIIYSRAYSFLYAALMDNPVNHLFFCAPFISIAIASIGFIGLFQEFFDIDKRSKKLNLFYNLFKMVMLAALLGLLFWPYLTKYDSLFLNKLVIILAILSMFCLLSIFASGLGIYIQTKNKYFLLYILTFSPMFIYIFVMWGMEAQVFEKSDFLYENGQIGIILIEVFVVGSLLAYRVYAEKLAYTKSIVSERNQIVEDLHSGLMPEIEILSLLNQQKIKPFNQELSVRIDELQKEIREDIRSLMWVLNTHKYYLLDQHLTKIRSVVQNRIKYTDIKFQVTTSPVLIPEDVKISFLINYHLFQMIKELANNSAKHSKAKNLNLEFHYSPNRLDLLFTDDGIGFDLTQELKKNTFSKRGIRELYSRAEKMNADLNISTGLNEGFKMQLKIPLNPIELLF